MKRLLSFRNMIMRRSTFANLVAASAIVTLLSGCWLSMPKIPNRVAQPRASGVQAGTTAVTVSITANTDQVSGLGKISLTKVVPREEEKAFVSNTYTLAQVSRDMAHDTTLFIGSLPPGQYYFDRLIDGGNANRYVQMGGGLGSFTVEEGKPLDLGRLIVTPLYEDHVAIGRSARVRDNRTLIERYSPDHLKLFAAETTVTWKDLRRTGDRVEEMALERPTSAGSLTELPDGSVAAATRMGTVLLRNPAGTWRRLGSDQIESLNSVQPVQMPDADFLALGEFGTLLRHVPGQDKLVSVNTGNLPYGNLIALAGNVNAGWYIAVRRKGEITVYHSAKLEGGDWSKMFSEGVHGSAFGPGSWFWMRDMGTGFAYATSEGSVHLYDYATSQWTKRATPKAGRVDHFRISGNGMWSAVTGGRGLMTYGSKDSYISLDQGKTWNQMEVSSTASSIPFMQRTDGALLRFDGSAWRKLKLQSSTDMGKTWTTLTDELQSRDLVTLKSGEILGLVWNERLPARFEVSKDGGKTWTDEFVE